MIELLIAMAIIAGISVLSVQSLWDTISVRSKQTSLETSDNAVRLVMSTLTDAIQSATQITISSPSSIQIIGSPCRSMRLNAGAVEQAVDASASCSPPNSGYASLTPGSVNVTTFSLSPVGSFPQKVTISLAGTYTDSIGSHAFSYQTTVAPRVTL